MDDNGVRGGAGSGGGRGSRPGVLGGGLDPLMSSDEDSPLPSHSQPSVPSDRDDEDTTDEGQFAFRRNRNSNYLPVSAVTFVRIYQFPVYIFVRRERERENEGGNSAADLYETRCFSVIWVSLKIVMSYRKSVEIVLKFFFSGL